jgi:hypothetical protein
MANGKNGYLTYRVLQATLNAIPQFQQITRSTRKSKAGLFVMKPIRTHLVGVAVALSTIAIAAPVATAGAATPAAGGRTATVVGPTYITSAPATFINNNNQVSPGDNSLGNQVNA